MFFEYACTNVTSEVFICTLHNKYAMECIRELQVGGGLRFDVLLEPYRVQIRYRICIGNVSGYLHRSWAFILLWFFFCHFLWRPFPLDWNRPVIMHFKWRQWSAGRKITVLFVHLVLETISLFFSESQPVLWTIRLTENFYLKTQII